MPSQPTIQEQAEFYDRWNEENRTDGFDNVSPEIRLRGERILARFSEMGLSGKRILEVGCGTGWLSQRLKSFGSVTAIDLSPKAIEYAAAHDPESEYIAADFLEYDFADTRFDVIVCVETLFYVEDQRRFMQKLLNLSEPGARLAFTTINSFVYSRSRDIGPPEPGQVRSWLSRKETSALIREYFSLDESFTIEPRGDMGILRLVNSVKLNSLIETVMSAERVKALKERAGLGGGILYFAHKP